MPLGTVVRFDEIKGYGFIAPDDGGEDVFVHANELRDRAASLATGNRVEFGVLDGGRGLKAYDVRLVDGEPPAPRPATTGGPLPSGALAPKPTPVSSPSPRATTGDGEETCEVFSREEFTRLATEMLLTSTPDLTTRQVLALRESLVRFATEHGWID